MEEKHSAMLVVCKKGSQIEKHRVSERFVIEGCGEIVKDKEIYEYRDSGKSRIYYNGQVLNSGEAGIQPVELREGDVLGLRDTERMNGAVSMCSTGFIRRKLSGGLWKWTTRRSIFISAATKR